MSEYPTVPYETKKIGVIFLIKKGDKFLFLKREHTGSCDGYYMLPGGHVDKGEPVILAAVRELKEELDITVTPTDLEFRLVKTTPTHIHLFFEVMNYIGTPKNNEPHKHAGPEYFYPNHPEIHPLCRSEINALVMGIPFLIGDMD